MRKPYQLAGVLAVSTVAAGVVVAAGGSSQAASSAQVVSVAGAGIAGVTPTDLGGDTVTVAAYAIPVGLPEHVGEVLPSPSLGMWTVPAGSSYSRTLAHPSELVQKWAKANGGVLNVGLSEVGADSARYASAEFRLAPAAGPGGSPELRAVGAGDQVGGAVRADADPVGAGAGTTAWTHPLAAVRPADTFPYDCGYQLKARDSSYGKIGIVNTWYNETELWTYGQTADSTIELDVSGSIYGPWSADGSVHIHNSRAAAVDQLSGSSTHKFLTSSFAFGKYKREPSPGPEFFCVNPGAELHAYRWNGGTGLTPYHPSSREGHCPMDENSGVSQHYAPNSHLRRSTYKQYTFTAGIHVFGVGLSIQSGFSHYDRLNLHTGTKYSRYWVCGLHLPATKSTKIWTGPNT